MAENQLLGSLRRYEFYATTTTFASELYNTMSQELYGDIHWEWGYSANNTYANSKVWSGTNHNVVNYGTITAKNVKDPSMFFTICVTLSCVNSWSDRMSYKNHIMKVGIRNNGSSVIPDLSTNVGSRSEIPFQTGDSYVNSSATTSSHVNTYYKWTVFTAEDYIFVYGEPQNYPAQAYPVRLYMGRLKPFEDEDPLIANDFVGVFSHFPMSLDDAEDELKYSSGSGYVRSSRNGTPNALYHFATSSQVPSPGVGGRFFISPFYVWHGNEGVRGEFHGVRTAVLRDASKYPDGSILDLGRSGTTCFTPPPRHTPLPTKGGLQRVGRMLTGNLISLILPSS